MQKTLMVSGVECETKVIDKLWHVVIDDVPQILYRGWVYNKLSRNKRMKAYKLKEKCEVCEKDFFSRLDNSRRFCGLSCFGEVNGKINIKKLHSKHIKISENDTLKIKAGSFISNRVASGRIVRPEVCSNCGCHGDIIFHHPNYDKPNEGMWLCIFCHRKLHFGHKSIKGKLIIYPVEM